MRRATFYRAPQQVRRSDVWAAAMIAVAFVITVAFLLSSFARRDPSHTVKPDLGQAEISDMQR